MKPPLNNLKLPAIFSIRIVNLEFFSIGEDQKERERDLVNAEMIPTQATTLSFWEKMLELQYKMLFSYQEPIQSHMFSSEPLEWPLLKRTTAYWVSQNSNVNIIISSEQIISYYL